MGEEVLVQRLVAFLRRRWRCRGLEPGDDAFCAGGGWLGSLVLNIDGGSLASSRWPWMGWRDVGWVWAVAAMSDLVAKAAWPLVLAASLGVEEEMASAAVEVVEGVAEAAERHGAWLGGGDLNGCTRGCGGWIDVAALGAAAPPWGLLARRPGPGDLVYTTVGRHGVGWAAARSSELGLLLPSLEPRVAAEVARPVARLGFVELASRLPRGCLTGSADVSDGLGYTLLLLSRAAGAPLLLEKPPSLHPGVEGLLGRLGGDVVEAALEGGQEYEIVFTVRPSCARLLEEEASATGLRVERIGRLLGAGAPAVLSPEGEVLRVRRWDSVRGGMVTV